MTFIFFNEVSSLTNGFDLAMLLYFDNLTTRDDISHYQTGENTIIMLVFHSPLYTKRDIN